MSALSERCNAEFHPETMSVLLAKQRISVSEPPFGGLGVTYKIHL